MGSISVWQFEMHKKAERSFARLDKPIKQRIVDFFEKRVLPSNNPRLFGKGLTGQLSGYWSYRVGDYRIIADIQDTRLTIVAVSIDHRRQVYEE